MSGIGSKPWTGAKNMQPYRTIPYKSAFKPAFPGISTGPETDPQAGRVGKKPPPELQNPADEHFDWERPGGTGGTGPWKRPTKRWDT
jgi:hypothetical protein